MKNSQKKNAKASSAFKNGKRSTKGQKNAPVRQKRLARAAVQAPPPTEKKPPMPKEKKLWLSLVALLCVFAVSFLTLGSVYLVGKLSAVPYASVYEGVNLKKYVRLDKSDFTDKSFDLSGVYQALYTLEDMDAYVKDLLLSHRTEVALGVKTTPVGYGDDVECYVIGAFLVDENGVIGEKILSDVFADKDYSSASYITVGAGSSSIYGISFGSALEDAIIALGVKPVDTYRALRTSGTVTGSDVIAISYTAVRAKSYDAANPDSAEWLTDVTDSTLINNSTLGKARLDLAELLSASDADKRFANAIIENCAAIEEPFEFVLENWDSNNDKLTESAVKYTATVHFAAEEVSKDVVFSIPADYFKETDGASQEYIALNGKEIALRMIFTIMNDYEVPSPTAAFLKALDENFKTDKTTDADVLAEFKAYSLNKLNAQLEKSLHNTYISEIYNSIVSSLYPSHFGLSGASSTEETYPDGAYYESYMRAYEDLTNDYYSSSYAAYGYSLSDYVLAYVSNSTGQQYTDANQALAAVAEQYAAMDLFMYYVFDAARLRVSNELLEEKYQAYLASLISTYSAADSKTEYNEAYFVENLGKDALYTEARRQAVYELVGEYLLENNNVTYGA